MHTLFEVQSKSPLQRGKEEYYPALGSKTCVHRLAIREKIFLEIP
jgi:hypothetical protein